MTVPLGATPISELPPASVARNPPEYATMCHGLLSSARPSGLRAASNPARSATLAGGPLRRTTWPRFVPTGARSVERTAGSAPRPMATCGTPAALNAIPLGPWISPVDGM